MLLATGGMYAQPLQEFHVARVAEAPKIDGVLDEAVWQQPALPMPDWRSYNPIRGDAMPSDLRTDVRIAYDDRHIYFAFHCFDREPDKIRTTIARRDSAFNDDWMALSLDSAGTGQSAYHLFVNPSGSQMDALNTSSSGEQFDADMIWHSVGKITADGYIVEVAVPLQTLRFSGGSEVRMGLVLFRKISRIGVSYSWPEMAPGQWVFDRPARLVFADLTQPRLFELLPSVTVGVNQARATRRRWNPADADTDVGIGGKFGITSNVTLDGTLNPDFSQVESDAFQVEVNQRFPIFYSEKRPFFMEGMGLFNVAGAGGGPGNMRTAVHTRRIVDPFWGTKLTGTAGKTTFGVLNAWDQTPEDRGNRGERVADRNKLFTIARATYALRRSDYIGAIFTDTEHAGRHNRVVGGDVSLRLAAEHGVSATALGSETGGDTAAITRGAAAQVGYGYNTRRAAVAMQVEHYGRDFEMDTAFYNRAGFTTGWSYGELNFYPREGTNFWIQRINPTYFVKRGHDDVQDGNEEIFSGSLNFNFSRQGHLSVGYARGHEPWRGRRFKAGGGVNLFGVIQAFRWLSVVGRFGHGYDIFYDPDNPFQGRARNGGFGFTLQPNQHFSQSVDVAMVRFDRASTGERVFGLTIVNLRAAYQFNRHFLVRVIEQFDSASNRLLTDLLASYEFVPGTVFHAGYGSLYAKRGEQAGTLVPGGANERYLTVNRGLFFKASYLHRF